MSTAATFAQADRIAGVNYYEDTLASRPSHPPLTEDIEADVAIVGAGLAGLSTALELAQRGKRVVLLEARRVAWAASGRNGGQLLPGFSCGLEVIERQRGSAAARALFALSIEGMAIVKERIARLSIDCGYRPGWLYVAARSSHLAHLRDWYRELRDELGYAEHVEWAERDDLARWIGARAYHGALVDHGAGHLNPLRYALGVAAAAKAAGVRIHEDSPVIELATAPGPVARTARGAVRAQAVVIASNVFVGALAPQAAGRILPVGNTIIATEPLDAELAARLLPSGYGVADSNFLLDYYRIDSTGRMLFGGGSTYFKHDGQRRIAAVRDRMVSVFPELAAARVDYAWGGLIDVTVSRAPDFSVTDGCIYCLQGFSGHGLNTTAIAGRVAAEAICGAPERFALFAALQHKAFPGGTLLRRPALAVGTLYYRMRDAIG